MRMHSITSVQVMDKVEYWFEIEIFEKLYWDSCFSSVLFAKCYTISLSRLSSTVTNPVPFISIRLSLKFVSPKNS